MSVSDLDHKPHTAAGNTDSIGVIGLGLIGGSLALAAKRNGSRVVAYNRSPDTLQAALNSGGIDAAAKTIDELAGCDVVFVAVPMSAYADVFAQLARIATPQMVITDGGSSKRDAIAAAERALGELSRRFAPAHPIAGKEKSGFSAADADLYKNHLTIICDDTCDADAKDTAAKLWTATGARIAFMPADTHDKLLAFISHLPHVLSYALVSAIERREDSAALMDIAAGGFRDFTRIAGSHPDMWRDICMSNRDNILQAIEWYQEELAAFAAHIKNGDADELRRRMSAARALRQSWIDKLEL